jgi:hypothetical protein
MHPRASRFRQAVAPCTFLLRLGAPAGHGAEPLGQPTQAPHARPPPPLSHCRRAARGGQRVLGALRRGPCGSRPDGAARAAADQNVPRPLLRWGLDGVGLFHDRGWFVGLMAWAGSRPGMRRPCYAAAQNTQGWAAALGLKSRAVTTAHSMSHESCLPLCIAN